LKTLHERNFGGKPPKIFKIYDDPFGGKEVGIELIFVDGHVEYIGIGPGRPEIVSSAMCYEHVQELQAAGDDAMPGFRNRSDFVTTLRFLCTTHQWMQQCSHGKRQTQ